MDPVPRTLQEVIQGRLRSLFGDRSLKLVVGARLPGGYMSGLVRVLIDSEDDRIPASMIIKLAADDPARLDMALSFDSYRKETRFYRHLAKYFDVRVPASYLNDITPDGDGFLLGLEDLGAWTLVDQGASVDESRTLQAMRTLAALHASSWNRNEHGLPAFDAAVAASAAGFAEMLTRGFVETGVMPAQEVRQLLVNYASEPGLLTPTFLEAPRTLIHSDFRSANIFFSDDGGKAAVVDWGDYAFGPAAFDLATFLTTSLSVDDRRAREVGAIKSYVACLRDAGIEYDFSDCWDDYRLMIPPCSYLPALVAALETDSRLAKELFRRLEAAVSDKLAWLEGPFGAVYPESAGDRP